MKFALGQLVSTPAALDFCERHGIVVPALFLKHADGDYGDVCVEDKQANEHAIKHGLRIVSAYKLHGDKLYCITEADRSSTCLMLASDY